MTVVYNGPFDKNVSLGDPSPIPSYRIYVSGQSSYLRYFLSVYQSLRQLFNREFSLDLTSKFHVGLFSGDLLHVMRIDNVDRESVSDLGFYYKPIDSVWRRHPGWPCELELWVEDQKYTLPASKHDTIILKIEKMQSKSSEDACSIPKVIFQASNITALCLGKAMWTWQVLLPDFRYNLITTDLGESISSLEGESVLHAFNQIRPHAFKVDLWRYVMLYHHGGIYADNKLFCLSPLRHMLSSNQLLVKDIGGRGLWNGFMALKPRSRLMRFAIDGIVEHVRDGYYGDEVLGITGPVHLYRCYQQLTPKEQSQYLLLTFDNTGLTVSHQGKLMVIAHNAEYRRLFSRPGLKGHYEEMWHERQVYTHGKNSNREKKSAHYGHLSILFLILILTLFLFKRRCI